MPYTHTSNPLCERQNRVVGQNLRILYLRLPATTATYLSYCWIVMNNLTRKPA